MQSPPFWTICVCPWVKDPYSDSAYESCIFVVEFLIQTKFENHIECDHVVREYTCVDWLLVTYIDFYLTWAIDIVFWFTRLTAGGRCQPFGVWFSISWTFTSACSGDTLLELHFVKGLLLELLMFAVSWKWDFLRKIWISIIYHSKHLISFKWYSLRCH